MIKNEGAKIRFFRAMYLIKTPNIVQQFYKNYIWRIANEDQSIFLSFDDGPDPNTTPLILNILEEYDAKASFFCLGAQVKKHRALYHEINARGHSVGNHGYAHLSGWATNNERYFEDVDLASKYISSKLFRPPYGKIRPSQAQYLCKFYKLIMWDVMTGDFDPAMSISSCFEKTVKKASSGSIIVMHENQKAKNKIPELLPMLLDYFSELDYNFKSIRSELIV